MLIGPALGGFLYALGGIMLPILINGVSFFGSGIFEIAIKYQWKTKKVEKLQEILEDMKEGFSFLRSSRYLITLIGFALFLNALGQPFGAILLPYSFREILKFSSLQFGLLESIFMGGAIVGNLLIAFKVVKKPGKYIFHSLFLSGMVMMIFIWVISPLSFLSTFMAFITLAAVALIWGSAEDLLNVPLNAKIQRAVPNELRGRVLSTLTVLVNLFAPVGLIIIGPLLDSYPGWMVAMGMWFLMLIVVLYYWLWHRKELTGDAPEK
jgi:DHA3 family macrolide efflux protein-like MFS transporter